MASVRMAWDARRPPDPRRTSSHEGFKGGCRALMPTAKHEPPATKVVGTPVSHDASKTPGSPSAAGQGLLRSEPTKSTHRRSHLTRRAVCANPTRNCSSFSTAVPGRSSGHACALRKEVPPLCGSVYLIGTLSGLWLELGGLSWGAGPVWPRLRFLFMVLEMFRSSFLDARERKRPGNRCLVCVQ